MRPQPGRGAGEKLLFPACWFCSTSRWRADRADQPSYRSERDPAVRDMRRTSGRGSGPQRDNAPHREHGKGLRGSEARTGACRSEDERGWSAPHAQREASAISVCGSRSTITGAKTERPFPGEHFSTSCWRAGPDDQPRHRRSVPSGQGGTTNPSNVGIKRFRDGSAGPRFVLAQAPAENGLSCGTHGGPGEDASAEQNGRGEFSKPTKAPGHGRVQERYGEKRAREKRRRSVTLRSFFDEPARRGRTK